MEQFCMVHGHSVERNHFIDLFLVPSQAGRSVRPEDHELLVTAASLQAVYYTSKLAAKLLKLKDTSDWPRTRAGNSYWLDGRDGMRVALACALINHHVAAHNAQKISEGILDLPEEVVLYWFTLCFYGSHKKAGRAALRLFLITPEDE